jgi:hypothetical protein
MTASFLVASLERTESLWQVYWLFADERVDARSTCEPTATDLKHPFLDAPPRGHNKIQFTRFKLYEAEYFFRLLISKRFEC